MSKIIEESTESEAMALLVTVDKIDRDLLRAIKSKELVLSGRDLRFFCDAYYAVQKLRIGSGNQVKAIERLGTKEPVQLTEWLHLQLTTVERQIFRMFDTWTQADELSMWARGIIGIGPVFAAALRSQIDFQIATTAGKIWRFCGLDPTVKWEKKTKRPWNAFLKRTCYLIGESFVRVSGNPRSWFGREYRIRKDSRIERNERGDFAAQSKHVLETKKLRKETEAHKWYVKGKLPPAHIHRQACREVVKIFLALWHEVGYELEHGEPAPAPWVIKHGGHMDRVRPQDVT